MNKISINKIEISTYTIIIHYILIIRKAWGSKEGGSVNSDSEASSLQEAVKVDSMQGFFESND